MSPQALVLIFAPILVIGVGWFLFALFRALRKGNLIIIGLPGKTYAFANPFRREEWISTPAPYIPPVNKFLVDFANSSEQRIEFGPHDLTSSTTAEPSLLRALQGLDYERIRLRLRAISSLDPIVNPEPEEGTVQMRLGPSSDGPREIKLRSHFAARGQSILLEKI